MTPRLPRLPRLPHLRSPSLRAKVGVLVAFVLTLMMALFGVVLYLAINNALLDNTAQNLRASAGGAIDAQLNRPTRNRPGPSLPVPSMRPFPPNGSSFNGVPDGISTLDDLSRFLTTRDTAARTTDAMGNPIGNGPAITGATTVSAPLLDPGVYQAVAVSNQERSLRYETANGPVLIELVPLVRETVMPPQTVGVLELSTSLKGVDAFLGRLRLLMVIGTLLAVLVTVTLTVLLVAGLLRPLTRMASTSRAIATGDLSRRVPVPRGDDELGRLARAFNEMVSRLESTFATQRRFIADASHELRSPLGALSGSIEMLQFGADTADPAARARLLRLMNSEAVRMSRLVDDLLTLTRFDANPLGTLRRAPVNLTTLVAEIADETRIFAPDRVVRFDAAPDGDIAVEGDADRLRQAILNLCANARAYTPPGGTITLGVQRGTGSSSGEGQDAIITVADTGEGIAAADLPRVWDRFYRADPARARQAGQGGMGLGLAIVYAIFEAHGGTATIDSVPGEGTTVTLSLPNASAPVREMAHLHPTLSRSATK